MIEGHFIKLIVSFAAFVPKYVHNRYLYINAKYFSSEYWTLMRLIAIFGRFAFSEAFYIFDFGRSNWYLVRYFVVFSWAKQYINLFVIVVILIYNDNYNHI